MLKPVKYGAASLGVSLALNPDIPDIASFVTDSADISVSLSFKNEKTNSEAKVYSGTGIDLAFSWKSGLMEYKGGQTRFDPKANAAQHYRLENISDFFKPRGWKIDNIAEFDSVDKIKLGSIKVGKLSAFDVNATYGAR